MLRCISLFRVYKSKAAPMRKQSYTNAKARLH